MNKCKNLTKWIWMKKVRLNYIFILKIILNHCEVSLPFIYFGLHFIMKRYLFSLK